MDLSRLIIVLLRSLTSVIKIIKYMNKYGKYQRENLL